VAIVSDESTIIALTVNPGQTHDAKLLVPVLTIAKKRVADIEELVGDKGFDSDELRRECLTRDIMPQLAARSNRQDAETFTYPEAYRTRNRVERFFCKLKQFRRIATRYEKLKTTFQGFLKLVCGLIRFKQLLPKNVNTA
jgi:transposase